MPACLAVLHGVIDLALFLTAVQVKDVMAKNLLFLWLYGRVFSCNNFNSINLLTELIWLKAASVAPLRGNTLTRRCT